MPVIRQSCGQLISGRTGTLAASTMWRVGGIGMQRSDSASVNQRNRHCKRGP